MNEKAETPECVPPSGPKWMNSLGMRFAWIPPGAYLMGSPTNETGREIYKGASETQHKVTLTTGFYLGIHLVTQEQWLAVMGSNPSCFKHNKKNLPVETVSWEDCQEFVTKLRESDAIPYRLPTEAEWEYACRAGTTTPFFFGDTISSEQANLDGTIIYGNAKPGRLRNKTMSVGSFPPNAWGLYDMHGNLFEWCQDWYGEYPKDDVVDPQGPNSGERRVLRGGAFLVPAACCRSAYRYQETPTLRGFHIGFRICFCPDSDR